MVPSSSAFNHALDPAGPPFQLLFVEDDVAVVIVIFARISYLFYQSGRGFCDGRAAACIHRATHHQDTTADYEIINANKQAARINEPLWI
jgi:hypothetical protein